MPVLRSRAAIAGVASTAGAAPAAGVADAAIPGSGSRTITACYPTSGSSKGMVRVIDSQAGAHCGGGQAMLTWPSRNFRWRGGWTGAGAYSVNDVVRYLGSAYIAVQSTNVAPTNAASRALMAAAGAPGVGGSCSGFPHVGVDWSLPGSKPGQGCDFTGANFEFANLTNAKITSPDAEGLKLSGANLTGANLTATLLTGATFTGAIWKNTICPDGTNSDAHGNTCVNNLNYG